MKEVPMNEYSIRDIAMNLTKGEFLGYCKGNIIRWELFSCDNKTTWNLSKRIKFWEGAFDKYSGECTDGGK